MLLRQFTLSLAIALTAGVFALDVATGRGIDLWLCYLIPISLASFSLGARYGYATALLACAFQFFTAKLFGGSYLGLVAFLAERGTEATIYVVCAYLVGLLGVVKNGPSPLLPLDSPTSSH